MIRSVELAAGHPAVGMECPLCDRRLAAGDRISLVPVRPASDEDAEKKAKGLPYTAEAAPTHSMCAAKLGYAIEGWK